jgi:MFS transporter, putative metabolite transport protein
MPLQEVGVEPRDGESAVLQQPDYLAYDEVPTTRFHVLVAVAAAGGQFSDGYALGTIGIALSLARGSLHLGALWLGALGSASLAGLFFGSLLLAPLSDRIGRRPLFVPTMAAFVVLSMLQWFATGPWQLLSLRLLLGLTLGVDYVVGCALVAEFSPRRTRGRLLALLVVMWSAGYTLAFIMGALLKSTGPDAWRWILASSAIPAGFIFLLRLNIPESPLWLIRRGRTAEAWRVIQCHIGRNVQLPAVAPVHEAMGAEWAELFSPRYRGRTAIGAIFFTAQVIPYFALGTFIPIVFRALGITSAYASGAVFNVFMLIGSGFGLWLIDRLTRRQYLVGTFYISALTLSFLVVARTASPVTMIAASAMFAFVLAAATSLVFVYLPELFPTRLRASGIGIATAASRIGSACGTFLLPLCLNEMGVRPTLGLCVGILLTGGMICHLFAPETQGHSIDDM